MSAAFKLEFDSALKLIDNHQVRDAMSLMSQLYPISPAEHRMVGHLRAKLFMKQNLLVEAVSCLKRTMFQWGEHVGLTADLAVCHYLLGDQLAWGSATDQLIKAFQDSGDQLQPDHYVRTAILIGKFEEERGEISGAIEIYESTLSRLSHSLFEDDAVEDRLRATALTLAQLVRVRALYQPGARLGELYVQLIKLTNEIGDHELDIETEHSLMQAELVLIGVMSARARLQKIIKRFDVDQTDRHLAVFDFIEAALRCGESSNLEDLRSVTAEEMAPFELGLYQLAFDPAWKPDTDFLDALFIRTPLANSLRFLTLACQIFKGHAAAIELRNKALLLISGLCPDSRAMWLKLFDKTLGSRDVEIILAKSSMKVSAGNRSVSLGRKKNMASLLEALSRRPELTLDEACRVLWDADYNESYYHRLRVQAQRLNELLFSVSERTKAVQVDSQFVRLAQGLEIKVET